MTIQELKEAVNKSIPLVWNDPEPIKGNDYTITFVEDIDEEYFEDDIPILIQYNEGESEALVYLREIMYK